MISEDLKKIAHKNIFVTLTSLLPDIVHDLLPLKVYSHFFYRDGYAFSVRFSVDFPRTFCDIERDLTFNRSSMNKDLFQNSIYDLYRLNVCYYAYVY